MFINIHSDSSKKMFSFLMAFVPSIQPLSFLSLLPLLPSIIDLAIKFVKLALIMEWGGVWSLPFQIRSPLQFRFPQWFRAPRFPLLASQYHIWSPETFQMVRWIWAWVWLTIQTKQNANNGRFQAISNINCVWLWKCSEK